MSVLFSWCHQSHQGGHRVWYVTSQTHCREITTGSSLLLQIYQVFFVLCHPSSLLCRLSDYSCDSLDHYQWRGRNSESCEPRYSLALSVEIAGC